MPDGTPSGQVTEDESSGFQEDTLMKESCTVSANDDTEDIQKSTPLLIEDLQASMLSKKSVLSE